MQHDLLHKKMFGHFDPIQGSRMSKRVEYLLAWRSTFNSHYTSRKAKNDLFGPKMGPFPGSLLLIGLYRDKQEKNV